MAVPTVYLNGQPFGIGPHGTRARSWPRSTPARPRATRHGWPTRPRIDVLIVGGGPAGAAAAIYAARKGIRTGVVAERFGGQTLDTLGIENFISVQETDGPKFAAALEAHVRTYDVDIMNGQRVAALEPAAAARRRRHRDAGQRRGTEEPHRDPGHRRALEERQRARRTAVPHQGRGLLPALRRPAVQGQEGGRHRRRQLRRRSRHRPGGRRGARHADRVPRSAQGRRGAGEQAQEPAQRHDPHQRADDRDHRRRPEGQRPALQGPHDAATNTRSTWPVSSCRSAWYPTPSG